MTLVYADVDQTKYIITDTSGTAVTAFDLDSATTYKFTYYSSGCPYNLGSKPYPLWYRETQSTNFIQCPADTYIFTVYSQPNISPQLPFGIFVALNMTEKQKITMVDIGGNLASTSIHLNSVTGTLFDINGNIQDYNIYTTNYGKWSYMRLYNMIYPV